MPHVRTKAPNGDGIVIMPEADYDRMIEELEDLRDSLMARRVLREIESGEEEMLTSAEADGLLAAKSPLAFWRKKRDLTQAALAEAAGISQAFLSEIESGQKPGTAATLKKIADALQITVDDFL
ncbi:helix-turn-helix domain-containing protein [Bradyrhizobium oligotrophicum]|uniref:helix-turn-helix domain-containing protein n=1 Tax=Bradyrhizobium oligotrophicum TaxID=44255 RepID=UPI003EB7A1EF